MTTSKRDALRAKIFSSENKQFKKEKMILFGASVEIRQPSLGMILEAQADEDRTKAIVNLLVNYCFIPDSDDKIFEEGDAESLLSMPFNDDLIKVNEVIERLTNIDVLSAEKNSKSEPEAEAS